MADGAPPFLPMEAKSVELLPTGDGWQFEPKWDGFRCSPTVTRRVPTSMPSPDSNK